MNKIAMFFFKLPDFETRNLGMYGKLEVPGSPANIFNTEKQLYILWKDNNNFIAINISC